MINYDVRQTPINQSIHPDSDVMDIDVWRLFDHDWVAREIDAKFERVQDYLARGDLAGLREFVESGQAALSKKTPPTDHEPI